MRKDHEHAKTFVIHLLYVWSFSIYFFRESIHIWKCSVNRLKYGKPVANAHWFSYTLLVFLFVVVSFSTLWAFG